MLVGTEAVVNVGSGSGERNKLAGGKQPVYSHNNKGDRLDTKQTLDAFLAHVEKRAYRMAFIATGHQDEALDLVQDAMLTLVRRYAQREPAEWGPLFTRIVQNRIRDWYRREKVRSKWRIWFGKEDADKQNIENLSDAGSHDPLMHTVNAAMTEKLEHGLRELPLRQQQVFLLRVWEGLDVAETAKALGISGGSVKTHYSRAVHRLREVLGDYYHE